MKNALLIFALVGLLLLSGDEPMSLVFALGVAGVLFRKSLLVWTAKWRSSWSFIVLGIALGIYTEVCALLGNMERPEAERILLDPRPMMDLAFGFFFYGLLILVWFAYFRHRAFSLWQVFLTSGFFGILTEQFNPAAGGPVILIGVFMNPLSGIPMALLIACVYAIFPTLAYFLTRHTFQARRRAERRDVALVFFALLFQWAIFGNIILPFLKRILLD